MKVLWITNIIFPAPCQALGMSAPVSGGWMMSSLEALMKSISDIEVAVATIYSGRDFKNMNIGGVSYYLLPSTKHSTIYDKSLESLWRVVRDDFNPDVVHIHGTECAHALAYIRACGTEKVCVSIQGLVSVIAKYYYSDISLLDILRNITFRDLLKRDTIFHQKKKFEKRGKVEREYLRNISNVIGRTSWDRAYVWAINPKAKYHFCNESLRTSFYNSKWDYDKCKKHTIFISQAGYPIKGLHKVLEALPLVLRHFPDTRVRVAGDDIIDKPFYRITGYGKYISSLIRQFNLEDKVTFLGPLTEGQMCQEYLQANIFICPSSIENSPNSLGEAQLLGVPCLASYVGGVPNMMQNEECLYRFEEIPMLAEKICRIFQGKECSSLLSLNQALERHNRIGNAKQLIYIYNSIITNS